MRADPAARPGRLPNSTKTVRRGENAPPSWRLSSTTERPGQKARRSFDKALSKQRCGLATGTPRAHARIVRTNSCAASNLLRGDSLLSSLNRTPGSFAAGWSQHTPRPSHNSAKITSSTTSSTECAIVSAITDFVISKEFPTLLADTARAHFVALDSATNHAAKSG